MMSIMRNNNINNDRGVEYGVRTYNNRVEVGVGGGIC